MERQFLNFLNITRYVLQGGRPDLDEPDWEEIREISRRQNLEPFVYEGVWELAEFAQAPESVRTRFRKESVALMGGQCVRTQELFRLYEAFLERGLKPLVLKGLICRGLYPVPDARASCDEDLWIRLEELEAYDEALQSCGYARKREYPDEILEEVQEITYTNGILTCEMHINPFGTGISMQKERNALFEGDVERGVEMTIEGHRIWTLPPTEHCLFLLVHLLKHFTGGGVGIRQILDQLLFMERYEKEIDFARVESGIASLGGRHVYDAILQIGEEYLGFTPVRPYIRQDVEALLADVAESGCFGNDSWSRHLGARYIGSDNVAREKGGFPFLNWVFPGVHWIVLDYPFLAKRPWLLPVAWCLRWRRIWRKIRAEKQGFRQIRKGVDRGRRRKKMLEEYGVGENGMGEKK